MKGSDHIKILLGLGCTLVTLAAGGQTITPSMVQQAQSMGITAAQIEEATTPAKGTDVQSSLTNDPKATEVDREVASDSMATQHVAQQANIFGQNIFSTSNLTFAPNYNMATPTDYILGPNDEVIVEVWGESEFSRKLKVSPEGSVNIGGGIGPIQVSGLTIGDAQKRIAARVHELMNGEVKVSLGQMRSIKVNLAGEVKVPGTYTLPSLATLFNALYSAGGINSIGSLRHVQVFRHSKMIADLDVYDYLINGKYDTNIRLEDNDMVIVPPYEQHVAVEGPVKRPMTYDLRVNETLSKLISFSGGFTGSAFGDRVTVYRNNGSMRTIQTVDKAAYETFVMRDGDVVKVDSVLPDYANIVSIQGGVWRPGDFEFGTDVATLSALIRKAGGLRGEEYALRGMITRTNQDRTTTVLPFTVADVAAGKGDIPLVNGDVVTIPKLADLQQEFLITVRGEVNTPQTIRFHKGMTVEDAILMCGGLSEAASQARIELSRRVKNPRSTTYTDKMAEQYVFSVSPDLAIAPEGERFVLEPFDEVNVRRSPGYSSQHHVTISGEVLYEGSYVLASAGERLSDVIQKAGGFTPLAYVKGASVIRHLTVDEMAKIQALNDVIRANRDVADSLSHEALNIMNHKTLGVDVEEAIKHPGCDEDIIMQDSDWVMIPKYNATVQIMGEVLYQNTVVYNSSKVKDYIYQAGGFKQRARKYPFIIYMNGKVAATRGRWFMRRYPKVEPGCVVVVPMKKVRQRDGNALATTMGIMTSTASIGAMVAAILNMSK